MTDFYNNVDKELLNKHTTDLAKISIEYILATSTITNMFHTFEQYIKIEYDTDSVNGRSFMEKLGKKCKQYDYDIKKNNYYDSVEKFRKLNNSIKHGKITASLKKDILILLILMII